MYGCSHSYMTNTFRLYVYITACRHRFTSSTFVFLSPFLYLPPHLSFSLSSHLSLPFHLLSSLPSHTSHSPTPLPATPTAAHFFFEPFYNLEASLTERQREKTNLHLQCLCNTLILLIKAFL